MKGCGSMDDAQILQLYFDRNEEAIPATDAKYGKYCTAIAKNILGSHEDAEECVNDTYLNTWNAIPPHRPGILSAFLGKITRNLAFNRYKHNNADKRGGGELPLVLEELAGCVSGKETVEDAFDHKALVEAINDFLSTLSVEKRKLFVCRYFYTESIRDIAEKFGISYAGLSMTLSRLRNKLQAYLIKRGYKL